MRTSATIGRCILSRPRHAELIAQVRETGARIRLISDGDIAGAIAAARPESGTDLLIGTGGTPEGTIAAAAMRCMGGALQARLAAHGDIFTQSNPKRHLLNCALTRCEKRRHYSRLATREPICPVRVLSPQRGTGVAR